MTKQSDKVDQLKAKVDHPQKAAIEDLRAFHDLVKRWIKA